MHCRFCNHPLRISFADLGSSPPSNAYLIEKDLAAPELWFPLHVLVCDKCWLVQTEDFTSADALFNDDYAYFSSYSESWLVHARDYVSSMVDRFRLGQDSQVIEVASNDGYLLQYFKRLSIACLGIEPTDSTARAAKNRGIETIQEFFGRKLAKDLLDRGLQADLMVANNVLAHVPDINDFVAAFSMVLKPTGIATFEFPHVLNLISEVQFDTIYHEHFSYLSLTAVKTIFSANGLDVFDVQELPTHGGSLRVYAQRSDTGNHALRDSVKNILAKESIFGISNQATYLNFSHKVQNIKFQLLQFLLECKKGNKKVAAYGAAAKGNTLLNFAGIKNDLIAFVADRNTAKQGKYLPGSRIPITGEEAISRYKPDYILLLPWNLKHEILEQLDYINTWEGKIFTAIPELKIIN